MSVVNIVYGQSAFIDPMFEYVDSGWVVDGVFATHYPCYPGTMEYIPALPLAEGQQYDVTYVVDNYKSGLVRSIMGGDPGTNHSAAGTFTDTYTYTAGDKLQFYSDGELRINLLTVKPHIVDAVNNSQTFAFHEPSNKWVENYSWSAEMMLNFGGRFFTLKNGQLWEHETNAIAGSFYGTKYPAQIMIAVNQEHKKDKLWYNLRLDAKGQWYAPTISIRPSNQFPKGMLSRLSKTNVKLIDGKLWGALLRDISDPNFASKTSAEALFNARQLQGGVLLITLECNDNAQSQIISAEFYYDDVERSF